MIHRCGWVNLKNPKYIDYHDHEWGIPLHDDSALFELLCLEGAQAGLTWQTILNRREAYRECFWDFDIDIILSKTDDQLLDRISGYWVIQNKLKTLGIRKNAEAYKKVVADHGSLDHFLWSFVDNTPIVNSWKNYRDAPASTYISEKLSQSLKKYGFTFVGPTICYAFMQACGMVSDHEEGCFRASS